MEQAHITEKQQDGPDGGVLGDGETTVDRRKRGQTGIPVTRDRSHPSQPKGDNMQQARDPQPQKPKIRTHGIAAETVTGDETAGATSAGGKGNLFTLPETKALRVPQVNATPAADPAPAPPKNCGCLNCHQMGDIL